jgi:hypothetical protein
MINKYDKMINCFESDVMEYLLNTEKCAKYRNKKKTLDELLFIYFESLLGKIEPIPRNVIFTNAIRLNSLLSNYQSAINLMESLFKNGNSCINKYLSKKAGNRDFLLRDIGLYHLHLSPQCNGRTNELLCVIIQHNNVYFIDISSHQKLFLDDKQLQDNHLCDSVWQEWMRLLNIIYVEHYDIIEKYRLKGNIAGLSHYYSGYEYMRLLRNEINPVLQIGHGYYVLPGGGVTTAGTSSKSTMRVNRFWQLLDDIKKTIESNAGFQKMALFLKIEDEFFRKAIKESIILSQ